MEHIVRAPKPLTRSEFGPYIPHKSFFGIITNLNTSCSLPHWYMEPAFHICGGLLMNSVVHQVDPVSIAVRELLDFCFQAQPSERPGTWTESVSEVRNEAEFAIIDRGESDGWEVTEAVCSFDENLSDCVSLTQPLRHGVVLEWRSEAQKCSFFDLPYEPLDEVYLIRLYLSRTGGAIATFMSYSVPRDTMISYCDSPSIVGMDKNKSFRASVHGSPPNLGTDSHPKHSKPLRLLNMVSRK